MSVTSIRTPSWVAVNQFNNSVQVITAKKEKSFYVTVWGCVLGLIVLACLAMASMLHAEDRRYQASISPAVAQVAVEQPAIKMVSPVAPQETVAPQQKPTLTAYKVQKGDTLWGLTRTHWPSVCEVNRLQNCHLIRIGQVIQIPQSFLQEQEKHHE